MCRMVNDPREQNRRVRRNFLRPNSNEFESASRAAHRRRLRQAARGKGPAEDLPARTASRHRRGRVHRRCYDRTTAQKSEGRHPHRRFPGFKAGNLPWLGRYVGPCPSTASTVKIMADAFANHRPAARAIGKGSPAPSKIRNHAVCPSMVTGRLYGGSGIARIPAGSSGVATGRAGNGKAVVGQEIRCRIIKARRRRRRCGRRSPVRMEEGSKPCTASHNRDSRGRAAGARCLQFCRSLPPYGAFAISRSVDAACSAILIAERMWRILPTERRRRCAGAENYGKLDNNRQEKISTLA